MTVPSVDGGLLGTTFTPRQMEVTIRATATPTAQVTTKFDRFQVRLTTGQQGVDILTTDYDCPGGASGAPNPILTRTTVVDVTPPTVTIGTPVHGGRYLTGATVPAQYTCTDAHVVTSCTGTVANGQPIATNTPGGRVFNVTGIDSAGNILVALRSYKTFNAVSITTGFTTADQAQLQAATAFFDIPVDQLPSVSCTSSACNSRELRPRAGGSSAGRTAAVPRDDPLPAERRRARTVQRRPIRAER